MAMDGMMFFFFKQKTAYEMRISDWSSDVCSSDLVGGGAQNCGVERQRARLRPHLGVNRVTDDRSIARIPSRIILPGTKQFAVSGNLGRRISRLRRFPPGNEIGRAHV